MKSIKIQGLAICAVLGVFLLSGCGNRAFVKGEYDGDVTSTNLLNDKWSETDMQNSVKELVLALSQSPSFMKIKGRRPVIMVTGLKNQTSEHIETQSIMDMFRVELMQLRPVSFVDKQARPDVVEEYEYQQGMMRKDTQSGPGSQIGADFILNGNLASNAQQAGRDKTVYYKLTMNLTDLKTNLIEWAQYKEIRKLYKKKRIRL